MLRWLIDLFAPRVLLQVRNIGMATTWSVCFHPHTSTSWRDYRQWHLPHVGETIHITEGIALIVRSVSHNWRPGGKPTILADFASPYPEAGFVMKSWGFNFYHHDGKSILHSPSDPQIAYVTKKQ